MFNNYICKYFIMNGNIIAFISNNIKTIQTSEKRTKLFEYLKSYVTSKGFVFLQEEHSSISEKKNWEDKFNGKLVFSHRKSNS